MHRRGDVSSPDTAAAAITASAIKTYGAIIQVEPGEFAKILSRMDKPVVIVGRGGWPSRIHKYMTAYGGFVFCTKSRESLVLPADIETIVSDRI